MGMNSVEYAEKVAKMWRKSRAAAGKSQDQVAKALGISKKTVQNWEAGDQAPNFKMALAWFQALGVPMYPYLMELLHPQEFAHINAESDMETLRAALHKYVDELDDAHVRELLFLLYGDHGSSPTGVLDVMTAYLRMPLAMRVCVADNILTNYQMAEATGMAKGDNHVIVKTETIERFVDTAKQAVLNGKETYIVTEN